MTLATLEQHVPMPDMAAPKAVVFALGVAQALVLLVAIAVACVVLARRQLPGGPRRDDP